MSETESATRNSALFGHFGLTLAVATTRTSDLDWLEENLSPAFSRLTHSDQALADHAISVTVDRAGFDEMLARGPDAEDQHISCFSFDGHVAEFLRWSGRDSSGDTIVYDPELLCFYLIRDRCREIEVLTGGRRPSVRIALERLLRELATQGLHRHQCIQLHAAAVEIDGAGLAICGPRRAGKSSLLIHLLRSGKAIYIANDRSLVRPDQRGRIVLSGMPTMVSIRKDTVSRFGGLRCDGMQQWRGRMTLDEALALPGISEDSANAEAALTISPAHLCHWLGVKAAADVPLRALVFPEVDVRRRGIHLQRLTPEQMRRNLLGGVMPPRPSVLAERSGWAWADPEAYLAPMQWPGISAYRCWIGRDAYTTAGSVEPILALPAAGEGR